MLVIRRAPGWPQTLDPPVSTMGGGHPRAAAPFNQQPDLGFLQLILTKEHPSPETRPQGSRKNWDKHLNSGQRAASSLHPGQHITLKQDLLRDSEPFTTTALTTVPQPSTEQAYKLCLLPSGGHWVDGKVSSCFIKVNSE